MKKLLILLLLPLAACQSEAGNTAEKTCAEPNEADMLMVGKQMRHYIAVRDFNSKNKSCWQVLRDYHKSENASPYLGTGSHLLVFIDTADPSIVAPEGGKLTEAQRGKVIAQELYNKDLGLDEFTPDAQAMGIYKEPQ